MSSGSSRRKFRLLPLDGQMDFLRRRRPPRGCYQREALLDRRRGISTNEAPKPRKATPDASSVETSTPVKARVDTVAVGAVLAGVDVGVGDVDGDMDGDVDGDGDGDGDVGVVTTTVTRKHSFAWTRPLTLSLELVYLGARSGLYTAAKQ